MEQRTCRYCNKPYPIEEFSVAVIVDGKEYRRHKCNTCYVSMKKDRRKGIRKTIDDYKKTLKCPCGVSDYRCLDFHHKDSSKEFNIGTAITTGLSVEKILKEIQKCEVLCSNCHRIHHHKDQSVLE